MRAPRPREAQPVQVPDWVKDETVTVPRGETTYVLNLDDAQVELMATGVLPEDVARKCWEALGWKREGYRNDARELAGVGPVCRQEATTT